MHTTLRLWRTALLTGAAALLSACSGDPAEPSTTAINSIRINPTSGVLFLPAGATRYILLGADQPAGAPPAAFSYQIADSTVATLSTSGDTVTVHGVTAGVTVINFTATAEATAGFSAASRSAEIFVGVIHSTDSTLTGLGFGSDQFVEVPAGSFEMGSTNGRDNERPVRTVTISRPFLMQKTEVTQVQWQEVMLGTNNENPSQNARCLDCPLERVTYNEILGFLERLNAQHPGKNYRLPTEAEWEYAARAGTQGDFGGTGVLGEMAWWAGNASSLRTRPVATLQPNAWGLYDMHGNVWEHVSDWYQADYYAVGPSVDPQGPATGDFRGMRGGSWAEQPDQMRSAFRRPGLSSGGPACANCGFRVVRDP